MGTCAQCAASYPDPLANMFLWAEQEQDEWRDGSADYEAAGFASSAPEVRPYLGSADHNWTTGDQNPAFLTIGPNTIARVSARPTR